MASMPPRSDGSDILALAPRERLAGRAGRRIRSVAGHPGLQHWFLTRGIPVVLGYATLYVFAGNAIGWRAAYDVNVGIMSPADTVHPIIAWFLSVAGWLVAPGIAGAIAGYVVSAYIGRRRTTSYDGLYRSDDDE